VSERNARPLSSVVICTFNRSAILGAAIRSVLAQTRRDLEVVVVDDGSTDETPAVVASIGDARVRYVHRENGGLSAARNTGVRHAAGRFVTFLDDDDALEPNWLDAVAAAVGSRERAVVTWGATVTDTTGRVLRTRMPRELGPAFCGYRALFQAGTFALDRDLYHEVGGFDEALRTNHQTEFALRLLPRCRASVIPVIVIDEPLTRIVLNDATQRARNEPQRLLRATMRILEHHAAQLEEDPELLSDYLATAGVAAARAGEYQQARALLGRAARATHIPNRRWKHRLQLAAATMPPIAERLWNSRAYRGDTAASERPGARR
jgi:glycosyltransferase involved in cell wall biosynthesis